MAKAKKKRRTRAEHGVAFRYDSREAPRGPLTKKAKDRWAALPDRDRAQELTRIHGQLSIGLRCLAELKGMRAIGEVIEWMILNHLPDAAYNDMLEAANMIFDTHREPECLAEEHDQRNVKPYAER